MSLEESLEKFGARVERLAIALEKSGAGGTKPEATTTAAATTDKKPKTGKKAPDLAAVKVVAEKLRDLSDKETVVALLKKIGKVGVTAKLAEDKFAPFIAAATKAIEEIEEEEEEEPEEEEAEEDEDC